ncbi:oligosaccharide flippase family protein [Arcicella sp. DC2W]|uniref:Oligosaccharide flippase family protein n=1 Tax=Arcicella gelida TaxID=2984195 RepID=A0ABU5S7V1_9BACT|nr:oligosaccharide flippase family protein [Arcicella sp. DC2W]MEA5404558.1 oligosaccharide flippase family protein [Arcicella sp. DC2W]
MKKKNNYVVKSFLWGGGAKILDAFIKFISVPLLLSYFGKSNFGLVSLAVSVNAYLGLLDMGINTGAIKHFSEWIASKKFDLVDSVARTSITFYMIIGSINSLVLIIIAFSGINIFSLDSEHQLMMRDLFLILAVFAIINWSTSVFNQLLTANENISYIQRFNVFRSIAGLILIFLTTYFKLSLTNYFFLFTLINSLVLVPFYLKANKDGLIKKFKPALDWTNFKAVFKYSLAILAIGIFSFSATKLRPIILAMFSEGSIGAVSDYRIMETITLFIISIGGMFISIFLPKTTKLLLENDKSKVEAFAYEATTYTSIICIVLCLPIMLNSNEILTLYVGEKYVYLSKWLNLWVITILFYLHNSPIASLVLSTGKTKLLVYCSAISCMVSIAINAFLCKYLEAGSAVVGYSVYILIQMSFYYFYFNNKVLGLSSFKVFKSFVFPTFLGGVSFLIIYLVKIKFENIVLSILLRSTLWSLIFICFLFITKILKIKLIQEQLVAVLNKKGK